MSLRLIIAGVLAVPSILVTIVTIPIVSILSIPTMYLLLSRKGTKIDNGCNENKAPSIPLEKNKKYKQVIITGGSSGIGLAIAKESARNKERKVDKIYILARDQDKLATAKLAILAELGDNLDDVQGTELVETISVDVTDSEAIKKAAQEIMSKSDAITENTSTHLFCCAGQASPMRVEDITADMYASSVSLNQLGTIYTVISFLPYLKEFSSARIDNDISTITLCSSICGLVGVYGYASYCPAKFAIRGFAECLHIELLQYPNLHVQVAFPADTDTPGFAVENRTKPVETALISEGAGITSANKVGTQMFHAAVVPKGSVPKFFVYLNFESFLICTVAGAFTPVTNLLDAVAQVAGMNMTRFIAFFVWNDWCNTITSYKNKTVKEQQAIETKLFPDRSLKNEK